MSIKLKTLITIITFLVISSSVYSVDYVMYIARATSKRYDYNNWFLRVHQTYIQESSSNGNARYADIETAESLNTKNVYYGIRRDSSQDTNKEWVNEYFDSGSMENRAFKSYTMPYNKINDKFAYYVAWDFDMSDNGVISYNLKYFTCVTEATDFKTKMLADTSVTTMVSNIDGSTITQDKPTTPTATDYPNCGLSIEYGSSNILKMFNLDNSSDGGTYPANNIVPAFASCDYCCAEGETINVDADRFVRFGYTTNTGNAAKTDSNFEFLWITSGQTPTCSTTTFNGNDPANSTSYSNYCYYVDKYTKCGDEGDLCSFNGTKTIHFVGKYGEATASHTNAVRCSAEYFGDATLVGPISCYYLKSWEKCADQDGTCSVGTSMSVRYGVTGNWHYKNNTSSNQTCNGSNFGGITDITSATCEVYPLI